MMFKDTRTILTLIISLFSILGITVMSIVYILVSAESERKSAVAQVFSGILPLYGTWVGTLLAFYFAKENFESSREAFQNSPSFDPLESILVSAVASNRFFAVSSENDGNKPLEELKKELIENKRRRLPILKGGKLNILVYYQDIDGYLNDHKDS